MHLNTLTLFFITEQTAIDCNKKRAAVPKLMVHWATLKMYSIKVTNDLIKTVMSNVI